MSLDTLVEAAKFLESSSKGTSRDDSAITRVHNSAAVHTERRRAFSESEPLERRRRPGGAGTRETHNKLEKNRRAHLKECFDVLKREVPSLEDKKTSNLNILRSALKYIQTLKKRERDYEAERDLLTSSNDSFRQRLQVLRREMIVGQENSNNALKESVEKNSASPSATAAAIKVRSVETQVSPVSVATQTTFSSAEEWKAGGEGASSEVEGVQVEAVGVPPSGSGHNGEEKEEERICVDDEDEEVDVEGEVTDDNNLEVVKGPFSSGPVAEEGAESKASDVLSAGDETSNHVKGDNNVECSPSSKTQALKRKAPRHSDGNKLETKKSNIQCCARVSS